MATSRLASCKSSNLLNVSFFWLGLTQADIALSARLDPERSNRGDWIRTSDLPVPNRKLYQAEPRPDITTRLSFQSQCTRFLGPEPSNNSLVCPMNMALRRDGMPTACLFGCSDPAHMAGTSASMPGSQPPKPSHGAASRQARGARTLNQRMITHATLTLRPPSARPQPSHRAAPRRRTPAHSLRVQGHSP